MVAPDRHLLWLCDADALSEATLANYAAWLSATEQERCARFARPRRRRQFIAGRTLLRLALARLLGMAPPAISLLERAGNAPLLLVPQRPQISFSISHSGPWVACAVSTTCRLGLDIELLDPRRDVGALAMQAFDVETRRWLASRPPEHYMHDFYRLWSTAEARFKLGGEPACTLEFSHPALSIVLCSEQRLAHPPMLEIVTLAGC